MKMLEVKPLLTAGLWAKDSILMIGVHGIGKSDVVRDWALENDIHIETLFLSNQEVGDLIGIPHNVEINGVVIEKWSVPAWLQRMIEASAKGKKCVLFLDEISRAPLDVKQAALQLVLEKKIHEHKLPIDIVDGLDTLIVAADNPDNGKYMVEPMDPALLDRFLSVNVEPDLESWLVWARANKVDPVIRAYLAENESKLHFMPDEGETDDTVSATPRSWAKLAQYTKNFDKISPELHYTIVAGKVGKTIAAQFINFMNNYESIVTIQNVEELTENLVKAKPDVHITVVGKAIKELIEDSAAIQIQELTQGLLTKYIKGTAQEAYPLMGMLYAINIETLVVLFKKIAKESPAAYKQLVNFDVELNQKLLFIKAAEAIVV